MDNETIAADFAAWWDKEGSGFLPFVDEDAEERARRVAEIAWRNGAYKAQFPTGQGAGLEPIVITQESRNQFTVRRGERYADGLCWEELLGVVAAATMPEPRPCLKWLRTVTEHDAMFPGCNPVAERA
jgi:hypothetical protein